MFVQNPMDTKKLEQGCPLCVMLAWFLGHLFNDSYDASLMHALQLYTYIRSIFYVKGKGYIFM